MTSLKLDKNGRLVASGRRSLEKKYDQNPTELEAARDYALCHKGLRNFVTVFWKYVEPARPLVSGWPLDAICDHLEAVSRGEILRLLINVPPGFMKSLLTNVFWPAYEWGVLGMTSRRYVAFSYSQALTVRDNVRFRQILMSDEYQMFFGDKFRPSRDTWNIIKVGNDQTGWKLATSVGGIGTGERGDVLILDDPNSIKEAESEAVRTSTNQWFSEVVPTRLNDAMTSAIVVIQQRANEDDVSGTILSRDLGYEHLMIPMEYDSGRHCSTSIGWNDPRGMMERQPYNDEPCEGADLDERDGELAWPERFPDWVVKREKAAMGEYAIAGQFQQMPAPRGGGIFKYDYWRQWPPAEWLERYADDPLALRKYPPLEYVVAALDTALTQKQENDYSALTIWGVWRQAWGNKRLPPRIVTDQGQLALISDEQRPKLILLYGWQKRLLLHGPPEEKPPGMPSSVWNSPTLKEERQKNWGLVEWVAESCRAYKIDRLLIENKTAAYPVASELQRLYTNEDWAVELVDPVADKVARAHRIQHLFSNGQVFAPRGKEWCETVVDQLANFPHGKHDDLVDSTTLAIGWLRDRGYALRNEESDSLVEQRYQYHPKARPLYPV